MKQITFSGWPENDMQNVILTSDRTLEARNEWGVQTFPESISAMTAGDYLCMVRGTTVYVGDYAVDAQLSAGGKELFLLGQELMILPDKKIVNVQDLTWSAAELTYQGEVSCSLCDRQGKVYTLNYTLPPTNPVRGEYWVDSTVSPAVLRQFGPNENWITVKDTCIRLQGSGIGRYFKVGDGVEVASTVLKGATVVRARGTDYLVVDGIMGQSTTENVLVRRWMPDMDVLTVCGDRLWGCRYASGVNTIYCCSPGDCKNWLPAEVSGNAPWSCDVASTGAFTGAAALGKTPIFFKENCMHRVTGTDPGSFRVETIPCNGVLNGCEYSLAVAGGKLYYCSATGVMEYTGSGSPRCILKGDFQKAWAGALDDRYFLCAYHNGKYQLLLYDAKAGIWSRQEDMTLRHFSVWKGNIYAVSGRQCINLQCLTGSDGPVQWYAESDTVCLADDQLLRRVEVCMEKDGQAMLSISCDGGGWESLTQIQIPAGRQVCSVNLRCRRCGHYRFRLDGIGSATLYSLQAETVR